MRCEWLNSNNLISVTKSKWSNSIHTVSSLVLYTSCLVLTIYSQSCWKSFTDHAFLATVILQLLVVCHFTSSVMRLWPSWSTTLKNIQSNESISVLLFLFNCGTYFISSCFTYSDVNIPILVSKWWGTNRHKDVHTHLYKYIYIYIMGSISSNLPNPLNKDLVSPR